MAGDVHHPERVLEARVRRPRIDLIGPGKLSNATESLESRMVDDFPLPIAERDESVDRTANFIGSIGDFHDQSAALFKRTRRGVMILYIRSIS